MRTFQVLSQGWWLSNNLAQSLVAKTMICNAHGLCGPIIQTEHSGDGLSLVLNVWDLIWKSKDSSDSVKVSSPGGFSAWWLQGGGVSHVDSAAPKEH